MPIKSESKKEFFVKEENDETNELTDRSPAQVETNGPETRKGIVTNCLYLRMWREPNFKSETIGFLERGDEVEVLERIDDYYKIRMEGKVVYVVAECIMYCIKEE